MKNNIVLICDGYPAPNLPKYIFIEQLVNEMVIKGVNITVIAPQSITQHFIRNTPILPRRTVIKIKNNSYNVYRPYIITFGNCPKWLKNIEEVIKYHTIKHIINKLPITPDIIYGHFWHNAFIIKKYAYNHDIPMVVACGEGDTALENLVARMSDKTRQKFANAVKKIICVSSENRRKCIQYKLSTGQNTIVLPNAINSQLFVRNGQINRREELGVAPDDFLIAFIGSFIHRKGSQRLAEAINKLNDPQIKVMFIGSAHGGDDATPHCQGTVLQRSINHNEIPSYLFSSNVFCLPTLNEGCSNAIVEALACGLPVISSNLPFNQDILDKTNSILIDPMNIDQIANAILHLKNDKQLCSRLSQGALIKVKNLTIEKRAQRILEFINIKC